MESLLFRNITIFSPGTGQHGQKVDLLIDGTGRYAKTEKDVLPERVFDAQGLMVSDAWVDVSATLNEPGFEHKDTIEGLCAAAARGGFGQVAVLPNTFPVVETKAAVQFINQRSASTVTELLPMAAISKETAGKELTEMIDLHRAGACAFTDGHRPISDPALLSRSLLYLQTFNGLLVNRPDEPSLSERGQMHEGPMSTMMGTKGMPALAEELAVQRDLALLEYTGGKIHFSQVSTAGAINSIRLAKAAGLQVSCDIAIHQLAFTDEDMADFDTNKKVNPPFRSKTHQAALWSGLEDGTIDAICSAHWPHDPESKELEFDLADFGVLGLESAFGLLNFLAPANFPKEILWQKLTTGPRKVLGLPTPGMEPGALACITVFHPDLAWTFDISDLQSVARNTPFIGHPMKGLPLGVVHRGKASFHPRLLEQYQKTN